MSRRPGRLTLLLQAKRFVKDDTYDSYHAPVAVAVIGASEQTVSTTLITMYMYCNNSKLIFDHDIINSSYTNVNL